MNCGAARRGRIAGPGRGRKIKAGIIGGTFDPLHIGHLHIAWEAKVNFGLDCVYFVPAAVSPHKKSETPAEGEHRYTMALLAAGDNPAFIVSRAELDREGKSYSIDTVRHFKKTLGTGAQIYLIIGSDSYHEFGTWKDSESISEECRIIVAPRNCGEVEIRAGDEKCFFAMKIPALQVSSSYIRQRLREGLPVKYLIPEPVEKYIREHNLYA